MKPPVKDNRIGWGKVLPHNGGGDDWSGRGTTKSQKLIAKNANRSHYKSKRQYEKLLIKQELEVKAIKVENIETIDEYHQRLQDEEQQYDEYLTRKGLIADYVESEIDKPTFESWQTELQDLFKLNEDVNIGDKEQKTSTMDV